VTCAAEGTQVTQLGFFVRRDLATSTFIVRCRCSADTRDHGRKNPALWHCKKFGAIWKIHYRTHVVVVWRNTVDEGRAATKANSTPWFKSQADPAPSGIAGTQDHVVVRAGALVDEAQPWGVGW